MEIVAKKTNKVFALDKIDFEKQPRSQRVSDRTRADQRRAGRSNFGNLKDAAQKHAGRYGKMGFAYIQDRMEKDPYYLFNSTTAQITADCCLFLEDLAQCISPDMGRMREKREKQLGTGVSTRLVFMPDKERDIRKPLDVTKEAMVSHHARLLTLPQFAVLAAELLKARGEPTPMLYGWAGSILLLVKQRRKNVSSTSLTSRDANGMNNITTSMAMITLLKRLRPPLTLRSSLWRDLQGLALVRDMRGSGETLIPSTDLPREKARAHTNARFSNRLLNAGSVANTVTSLSSVRGAGTAAGDGKPDTQAAREGRLIDQIGERATKAEDGEISGADQLLRALPLLRSQLNFQDDLLLPIIQRR